MAPATAARRLELDGLRALAVLAVLVAHSAEEATGAGATFLGDLGSRGVDLFFVLSGFCLSYPLLQAGRACSPSPFRFLRHRLARIAPPYYVAIALFGVLALTRFGIPTWPLAPPAAGVYVKQLVLDSVFLPNVHPLHNADFWTLGIEMHWYLVFPLVMALFFRSRIAFLALGIGAMALYQTPLGVPEIGIFPCFLFGIFAADLVVREVAWRTRVWPFALGVLALATFAQYRSPGLVDHCDPLWQLAAFLSVVAVTGTRPIARAFSHPAAVGVGVASYSIYLVHHPLVSELARTGVPLWFAAPIALGGGFVFWRLVEVPLLRPRVRRAIENALRFSFAHPARERAVVAREVG